MRDHYQVLGIEPTASFEQVRTAYREREAALRRTGSASHEQTEELSLAFSTLSNPVTRAEYDWNQKVRRGRASPPPADPDRAPATATRSETDPDSAPPPPEESRSAAQHIGASPRPLGPAIREKVAALLGQGCRIFRNLDQWLWSRQRIDLTGRHRRELQELLRAHARALVGRILHVQHPWPIPVPPPEGEIRTLHKTLVRKGIPCFYAEVDGAVSREWWAQIHEHFARQFLNRFPHLRGNLQMWAWVNAYVDAFGANAMYYPMVETASGHRFHQLAFGRAVQEESFRREAHRREIARRKARAMSVNSLSGTDFEELLADLFRRMGYRVETTPATGDQGADLILIKGQARTAVQAKRYSRPVSNSAVQEVVASMRLYRCQHAMVVTTSQFTRKAVELAEANQVTLVDGAQLEQWLYEQFLQET